MSSSSFLDATSRYVQGTIEIIRVESSHSDFKPRSESSRVSRVESVPSILEINLKAGFADWHKETSFDARFFASSAKKDGEHLTHSLCVYTVPPAFDCGEIGFGGGASLFSIE